MPATTIPAVTTAVATTTTTTTPTTTVAPTTTTLAPTTTVASATGDSVLTGTDWAAIVQTLGQRRQDLYAQPSTDPARIDEICAPADGSCTRALAAQIPDLASKGWHVEGTDPYIVLPAEVVVENIEAGQTIETARFVTVVVTVQRQASAGSIVDGSGAVQANLEYDTPEGSNGRSRVTLARIAPGQEWRLLDLVNAGTVPA